MAPLLALLALLLLLVARQAEEEAQDGLQVALLDVCTQDVLFSLQGEKVQLLVYRGNRFGLVILEQCEVDRLKKRPRVAFRLPSLMSAHRSFCLVYKGKRSSYCGIMPS